MSTFILAMLAITVLLNIGLGIIVLQRSLHKLYGWLFAATVFSVAAWGIGDMVLISADRPETIYFAAELFYIAPLFIPMAIMLFSYVFPEVKKIPKLLWVPCAAILIGWSALLLINLEFIYGGVSDAGGFNSPIANLPGFLLYTLHFSLFFIITYVLLLRKIRRLRGVAQAQVTYTFYGVVVSSILAMMTNLTMPIRGVGQFVWLGPIFTLIFAICVTVAIVRYKLFDIRSFVFRALGYLITTLVLAFIYIAPAIYVVAIVIMGFPFIPVKFMWGVVAATVFALFFHSIRQWFDRISNRLFFRDAYDPAVVLSELNRILVSSADLQKLLKSSSDLITKTLKTEYCTFALRGTASAEQRFIGNNNKKLTAADLNKIQQHAKNLPLNITFSDFLELDQYELKTLLLRNDTAVLINLVDIAASGQQNLGYLLIGYKKSGKNFNKQDANTLEAMADVLVIAIQNALRFEEIQKFNLTLQQKIDEQTRELRRANTKLISLDESKDDFISMASHQLRTPLTAVKGYLSMVVDGDAGPINAAQHKMLAQAYTSSQRMVYLIADLLNVSRLKTGKFVLESSEVNLANVISQEIGQLHEQAASQQLRLKFDRPKDFPILMLDETKIRQVIMNFIDNAMHYTRAGGHITVELRDLPRSVELRVNDDGIGVPRVDQHKLFTKFYRAANARRQRPDGTGLGLYMAKKVIMAHGGAVIFTSKEGKGSTFGFTLYKEKLRPPPPPKQIDVTHEQPVAAEKH